jgi:hypothetical protein
VRYEDIVKFLQRIADDLKRGENLDLFVTIVGALIVAIMNLFGVAPQGWMDTLGLAVLALLASSILGNRHRLDDIQKKLRQSGGDNVLKEFPPELEDDLERASEIWLFGVHVLGPLRFNRSVLENNLIRGNLIRVLIVDPKGVAPSMTAARAPGKLSVERERASILANLDDLCELKKIAPSKLEIRVIDDPILYGGYMLNPDDYDGVIYLRRYTYQVGFTPRLVYRAKNQWFELTKTEIRSLWNRGTEWKC